MVSLLCDLKSNSRRTAKIIRHFVKTNRHLNEKVRHLIWNNSECVFRSSHLPFRILLHFLFRADKRSRKRDVNFTVAGIKKLISDLNSNILPIFAPERGGLHTAAMKRETGENPVQSRCCMFRRRKHRYAIDLGWEGVLAGISQKTCHLSVIASCPRGREATEGDASHRASPIYRGGNVCICEHHLATYLT